MAEQSLFSKEIWERYLKHTIEDDFKVKKYPQLDPFFDFSKNYLDIEKLLSDPSLKSIAEHSFLPFVKILTKTPRFKYQEDLKKYALETKIRPIAFASHFDSYIYSFYSFALTEQYQKHIKNEGFSESILAYRNDLNGKCNIQFAKEVFDIIKDKVNHDNVCTAIALDITGYFDNIDHQILKEKWCRVIGQKQLPIDQYKIFRSLTKYSYVNMISFLRHFKINLENHKYWTSLLDLIPTTTSGSTFKDKFALLRKRRLIVTNLPKKLENGLTENRGIPQGSPMSAVLSNIYLLDFDKKIYELGIKYNFKYRRYCDDLIIICHPNQVNQLVKDLTNEIKTYKLTIQSKKTEIICFRENSKGEVRSFNEKKIFEKNITINGQNEQQYYKNLQYLGFEFNGKNIYIRPGSLSRYFNKMKRRIIKTIVMSYSDKSKRDKILKKQIFERYSHLGKRNFLSYAINASKKEYLSKSAGVMREGMDSKSIRRQISAHFSILEQEVLNKSSMRYEYKNYIHIKKKAQGRRSTEKNLKI